MKREYLRWKSPHLHREMELLVFGHSGAKVLIFPTRDGRFYEYENLRMVERLRPKIEAGELQLWCLDNMAGETFYCYWRPPAERVRRHEQFEDYILEEVFPFMEMRNDHPCTISHGLSLGAYQAAAFAFRHPDRFRKLAAFSGRYDLTLSVEYFSDLFEGHYDETVYYHTPTHFLPRLKCPDRLRALRQMDIIFTIGEADPFLENNRQLSRILRERGIPHQLHVWHERAHSGYYWRRMAPLYL